MKRRLLIVAVFLLAGAVVNVAVAWGCAAISTDYHRSVAGPDVRPLLFTSFGCELVSDLGFTTGAHFPNRWMEESCGWPWLAMRWYMRSSISGPRELHGGIELGGVRGYELKDGLVLRITSGAVDVDARTLPLIPIWPGFAVNTSFYAALLWLLICGPLAMRRFIRVRRGLCPACAYPRGESDVCSECGKALVVRRATT